MLVGRGMSARVAFTSAGAGSPRLYILLPLGENFPKDSSFGEITTLGLETLAGPGGFPPRLADVRSGGKE